MKIATWLTSLALGLALSGCGESSAAELEKTPAEVQTEAAEMDESALDAKIAEYKTMIADLEKQVKTMGTDLGDAMSEGIDAAVGKGEELIGDGSEVQQQLVKLKDNLKIYMDELAKR